MPDSLPLADEVQAELRDVTQALRQCRHLDPSVQRTLADLLDELRMAINTNAAPSAELLHLANSAAQVAKTLHAQDDKSVLEAAREQLQRTMARGAIETSQLTEVARRFLSALANIGI